MPTTCGSTDTRSGEPCQRGVNCPYHRGPGRPTDYRPSYCEKVIELGRQGHSRAVMARELDVSIKTLHNWEARYPEFLQATTRARELARAWWEDQGLAGIWAGSDFNATAYRLQMMNRFPAQWRDRKSIEHSGPEGGPIEVDVDDARERLDRRIARIAERRGAASGAPVTNGAGG